MEQQTIGLSTESTAVARVFAAMRLAEVATIRPEGGDNAAVAAAYGESFRILYETIGAALRAK
ncbi:MAG TPA: hypothetical protein VFK32_10400 [Tepidiformaceae bacterium]|nr:hypothetical protein [Tepidiformaceae bacterium]